VRPVEEGDELRREEGQHEVERHRRHRLLHRLHHVAVGLDGARADAVGQPDERAGEEDEGDDAPEERGVEHAARLKVTQVAARRDEAAEDEGHEEQRHDERELQPAPLGRRQLLQLLRLLVALVLAEARHNHLLRDVRPRDGNHQRRGGHEVVVRRRGDDVAGVDDARRLLREAREQRVGGA
jgi:hypothetical protein